MKRRSISLPGDLDDTVDERRSSRTSRSVWFSEAARVRLHLEEDGSFKELLEQAEASPKKQDTQ